MVSFNPVIVEKLNSLSETVLNGHYIYSNGVVNDDYLAKRFSTPDRYAHNVKYVFTKDKSELEKYFLVRNYSYKETHGNGDFTVDEDIFDHFSHVLLVKQGEACVGGARLTLSNSKNPSLMPLEKDGLNLKQCFPNIDFSKLSYCEMSRLALLPEYRNGEVVKEIYSRFINICEEQGVEVGFARSPVQNFRRFRLESKYFGLDIIPREDIDLDEISPEGIKMVLFAIDFTKDRRYASQLTAEGFIPESLPEAEFA